MRKHNIKGSEQLDQSHPVAILKFWMFNGFLARTAEGRGRDVRRRLRHDLLLKNYHQVWLSSGCCYESSQVMVSNNFCSCIES